MGYDLHITRQENWSDQDDALKISLQEWKEYINDDAEMRLDNFAEAHLPDGKILRVEDDGIAVWTKYSGDEVSGNHAWFNYYKGRIVVKNPDEEIINKMLDIAIHLKAKVQGDEGELYERSANGRILTGYSNETPGSKPAYKKPWWNFWR